MRAIAKPIGFVLLAAPILFLMAASVGLAAIGAARYAAGLTESGALPIWHERRLRNKSEAVRYLLRVALDAEKKAHPRKK
jgi:hypothetical protein